MASSESFMFSVESPAMLHLCVVPCGPTIFDVAMDICANVDVIMKVMREGLINLLVVVVALTTLGARWVAVMA